MSRGTAGATFSDGLVFLATLSLAVALLYPAWSARSFRARVSSVVADVEGLASAARGALRTGAWPTPTPPGQAPRELIGLSGEGGLFSRTEYTLGWTVWDVVDSIQAPQDVQINPSDAPPDSAGPRLRPVVRTVGGITVYSREPDLLAELARRYSTEISFVVDTTWTLVLPDRGPAPQPGG